MSSLAKTEKERKQLEEHIHREKPPQIVRDRHAEVPAALLPDPPLLNRRGCWIKTENPDHHEKRSNKGDGKGRECAGLAANIPNENGREHPGEVASGEVGQANDQRHQKEFGAECIGVMIVPERETSQNTRIFQDIA